MRTIKPEIGQDLLELSQQCGALYICPKENGVRKGPLVVYAGKDNQGRNLVGDIYFNFRVIEQHPWLVKAFALKVFSKLNALDFGTFDTICGIPEGGRTLGQMLAYVTNRRFTYPTKVPIPTAPGKKQEYRWDLSQFSFEKGERIIVVEDIFNNFNNTDSTLNLLREAGARVVFLAGALNRSPKYDTYYLPKTGHYAGSMMPIVTALREPYPEYEQDDPEVASDIAAGNLELEVKKNWQRLLEIQSTY